MLLQQGGTYGEQVMEEKRQKEEKKQAAAAEQARRRASAHPSQFDELEAGHGLRTSHLSIDKPMGQRISKVLRKLYRKLGLKHLIALFVVAVYTLIGGLMFMLTEYSHDVATQTDSYNEWMERRHAFLTDSVKLLQHDTELVDQVIGRMHEIARGKYVSQRARNEMIEAIGWYDNRIRDYYARNRVVLENTQRRQKRQAEPPATNNATVLFDRLLATYEDDMEFTMEIKPIWHFWNALYFSGTLYTTIGYGNIACATFWGQLLTIIYSLIGIPIMLTALNDLGKWLFRTINSYMSRWTKLKKWVPMQYYKWRNRRVTQEEGTALESQTGEATAVHRTETAQSTPEYELMMGTFLTPLPHDPEDGVFGPRESQTIIDLEHLDDRVSSKSSANDEEDIEDLFEEEEAPPPKIPVLVALSVTIGWIFFCAGLFCIWEDWNYWTSIYFFFISLSTIGLGDVTPDHPEYMVGCFLFVIIGLSLVSMCISVVQEALEDAYLKLLMKILVEYQKKLAEGGGTGDAAVGMMDMWNSNPAAKYLLPLMGKDKKGNVMAKFQEDAKAKGIELPAALLNVDRETGLPAVIAEAKKQEEQHGTDMKECVKAAVQKTELIERTPPPPPVITQDSEMQTENFTQDKYVYMDQLVMAETEMQTLNSIANEMELSVQTDNSQMFDRDTQTRLFEVRETEMQTLQVYCAEADIQTVAVLTVEDEQQTVLIEHVEVEQQTLEVVLVNQESETVTVQHAEGETNTLSIDIREVETQTVKLEDATLSESMTQTAECESVDAEDQTDLIESVEIEMQTDETCTSDQQLQTHLYDLQESEQQTTSVELVEIEQQTDLIETHNQRIQTPLPETNENHAQTFHTGPIPSAGGPIVLPPPSVPKTQFPKQGKLRTRTASLKPESPEDSPKTSGRRNSETDAAPEDIEEEKKEESSEEEEQVVWDPVDGLHAEKQRNVKDLLKMFGSGKVNQQAEPVKPGKAKRPFRADSKGSPASGSSGGTGRHTPKKHY